MERRFSSLRNKLSRNKADMADATSPSNRTNSNNPFSTNAPATRRPDRPGMNAFSTPSNEPPPAYSPPPPQIQVTMPYEPSSIGQPTLNAPPQAQAVVSQPQSTTATSTDDPYSFLATFDTMFLIDDSGSMAGRSWRECSLALEAITPICTAHDADGIDLYFLNAPESPHHRNVTLASTVHEIFSTVRPSGGTPTGQVLNRILKRYLAEYEANPTGTKPLNIIVITDGVPADDVESVIIFAAKKLDRLEAEPWQVGIQMFQTGEEEGAREHLESLDDELSRMGDGCRDIVDTVPFVPGARGRGVGLTADNILKVVLGAVNRRLDRRSNARAA